MPPPRCRSTEGGDTLDQQLADRLNSRLTTDGDADYAQSLRPVFKEILYWTLANTCLVAAAIGWSV